MWVCPATRPYLKRNVKQNQKSEVTVLSFLVFRHDLKKAVYSDVNMNIERNEILLRGYVKKFIISSQYLYLHYLCISI